jgi:hypothetical protein
MESETYIMQMFSFDVTTIELLGLSFSSVGILMVLVDFGRSRETWCYGGGNPHQKKAVIIRGFANKCFTFFAGFGLFLSACSVIFESDLPVRSMDSRQYLTVFTVGILVSVFFIRLIIDFSPKITKRKWKSEIKSRYQSDLPFLCFHLDVQNAFFDEYVREKNISAGSQASFRETNQKTALRILEDIELLFEVPVETGTPAERLTLLLRSFDG